MASARCKLQTAISDEVNSQHMWKLSPKLNKNNANSQTQQAQAQA